MTTLEFPYLFSLSDEFKIFPHPALRATLDVPLACKDALYVRSHYDTVQATMPDAPLPDEVVVILVGAGRGRLHARIGGLLKADVKGRDIYLDRA